MVRRRILVAMQDTLLAEALVGDLGNIPELHIHVVPIQAANLAKEVQSFEPDVVLLDRHPGADLLRLLAAVRAGIRVAVVAPQEPTVTLYEVSHREVARVAELVALLARSEDISGPEDERTKEARGMQYARITRLYPLPGYEERVREMLERYLEWLKVRPGFLLGLCLSPAGDSQPLTRVTVWEGRGWADATALSEHALATRSQLTALTSDQAIHEEEFNVRLLETAARPGVAPAG